MTRLMVVPSPDVITLGVEAGGLPMEREAGTLYPPVLKSAARALVPSVAFAGFSLLMPLLDASAAVLPPSVSPGPVEIAAPLLDASAQVLAPSVQPGAATVQAPLLDASAAALAPAVAPGAVALAVPVLSAPAVVLVPTVQPIISLDFTTGVLPAGATLSRSSKGWNSSGQEYAIDVARFDLVGGVPCLLYEPFQRTNLCIRNREFEAANWIKAAGADGTMGTGVVAVVTANYATAPDGTQTADRVVLNTGAGVTSGDRSGIYQSFALTNGAAYTPSLFMKTNDGSTKTVVFFLSGTTFSSNAHVVTGELQRFSVPSTAISAAGSIRIQIIGNTNSNADLSLWGAQLELGSFASSPIPTGASQVTRAADVLTFNIPASVFLIRVTFDNDTTQDIAVTPGTPNYQPTGLNRTRIKTIVSV